MRFMVMVKASEDSEAGVLPSQELLTEMGKYNEELVKAGVMLAGEGLHPSSKGKRVRFSGDQRMVTDGPFTETKEQLGGFCLIDVESFDEALEWARKVPLLPDSKLEIRQVKDLTAYGYELSATPGPIESAS